jgi:hypothetical protein
MGWSIGYDDNWKRDVGYGVPATCDHPGCDVAIDRGLAYVCGGDPYGGEHGCGLFFCEKHRYYAARRDAELCARCHASRHNNPFKPKPDTAEWITHKLTHPSWAEWRAEHPDFVASHQAAA